MRNGCYIFTHRWQSGNNFLGVDRSPEVVAALSARQRTRSAWELFLLNVHFPRTPRWHHRKGARSQGALTYSLWNFKRSIFLVDFCPVFFSSHITACHTSSLCCQLDTVAYHFHYLQSLTFYFMLVSPCPQFRFLSTFPVSLHFLFTPWLSPIQRRCLLKLQNVASRQ